MAALGSADDSNPQLGQQPRAQTEYGDDTANESEAAAEIKQGGGKGHDLSRVGR